MTWADRCKVCSTEIPRHLRNALDLCFTCADEADRFPRSPKEARGPLRPWPGERAFTWRGKVRRW